MTKWKPEDNLNDIVNLFFKNENNILIILPTLNEEKNIENLYKKIKELKYKFKYLFIDDGSTDGTLEAIKNIKNNNKKYLSFEKKKGLA